MRKANGTNQVVIALIFLFGLIGCAPDVAAPELELASVALTLSNDGQDCSTYLEPPPECSGDQGNGGGGTTNPWQATEILPESAPANPTEKQTFFVQGYTLTLDNAFIVPAKPCEVIRQSADVVLYHRHGIQSYSVSAKVATCFMAPDNEAGRILHGARLFVSYEGGEGPFNLGFSDASFQARAGEFEVPKNGRVTIEAVPTNGSCIFDSWNVRGRMIYKAKIVLDASVPIGAAEARVRCDRTTAPLI